MNTNEEYIRMLKRLSDYIKKDKSQAANKVDSKNISTDQAGIVEVPSGQIHVAVRGEHYSRNKPDSVELREKIRFSITPKDEYQIKMGWPEGNFFNVNIYPSTKTDKDNWLGYVPYDGKPAATKLAELVSAGKHVTCWGFYDYDSDHNEIDIFLALPKQA